MKRAIWFVIVGVLVVVAAMPVQAQDKKEIQGYVAGGYVMPQGRAGDFLNDGWNISGGAIFRPAPDKPFGVRLDLGYSDMGANNEVINVANANTLRVDDGYVSMGNITAEALWEFGSPDKVGGYLGVGMGGYRRYAALTAAATVAYCDPWWGYCYPVAGQAVVNSDSLTKFGYSGAAGITFAVGNGQMYLEARYHYMISDPATEYIPILIGYRF